NLQSQPIVSITNLSADTSLIGLQLDLSKSASKIVSCTWLEAPATASWNWHDPSASALFQFRAPIAPGNVVTMRLGTAARPNDQGLSYMMNQTLFHPSLGDCLTTSSSFGEFTLFFRPVGQTSIPQFDASGRPVPDSSTAQTISFANSPIIGEEITSLNASSSTIVPVPEPETVALAMSAIGIVIGCRGLRRRAA
ncbi:MAG: PEP-CTERM sorting domain-containing protein, partial [Planctomycetia bacterium]